MLGEGIQNRRPPRSRQGRYHETLRTGEFDGAGLSIHTLGFGLIDISDWVKLETDGDIVEMYFWK